MTNRQLFCTDESCSFPFFRSGCFPEVVRFAKKGGILAVVMNNEYWEGYFDIVIKSLEEEKVIQVKYLESVDGYCDDKAARILFLYKL